MAPPTGGTPGNAELMRAIEAMRTDLRDLTKQLDTGYVRKDVYAADQQADAIETKGVEDEQRQIHKRIDRIEERLTAHFRLLLAGLVYPLLIGAITYILVSAVQR